MRRRDGMGLLIFGCAFLVIGGALLYERTTGQRVFYDLWCLWPLLLSLMGVKMLYDHFTYQPPAKDEPR